MVKQNTECSGYDIVLLLLFSFLFHFISFAFPLWCALSFAGQMSASEAPDCCGRKGLSEPQKHTGQVLVQR